MFNRIFYGAVMVAAVIALLIFDNTYVRLTLCMLLMLIANKEMVSAMRNKYPNLKEWPGYLFTVSMMLSRFFIGSESLPFALFITLISLLISFVAKNMNVQRESVFDYLFSMIPLLYPLSFFYFLSMSMSLAAPDWRSVLLFGIAIAALCDTFALFGGMAFGKHKMAKYISPNKTWEGAICGFLFGGIGGGIVFYFAQPIWGGDVHLIAAVIGGALMGILGQLGDLTASSIKRAAGIKDFGNLVPGHGGVIDRFDSILFTVPIAYAIVTIF